MSLIKYIQFSKYLQVYIIRMCTPFNDFCGVVFASKLFKFAFADIKLVKISMSLECIQHDEILMYYDKVLNLTKDIHLAKKHSTCKEIGNFAQAFSILKTVDDKIIYTQFMWKIIIWVKHSVVSIDLFSFTVCVFTFCLLKERIWGNL